MGNRTVIINANLITGFAALQDCGVFVENGFVHDVFNMKRYSSKHFPEDTEVLDVHGSLTCAGLIDTHIHGIGGYGTEDCSAESILGMSEALADFGVTAFLPTVYPQGKEELFKVEQAICDAMGHEKGAKILGMNIEGPFLSPRRHGALPEKALSAVDTDYFDEIINHGHGNVVCMTVAPELKNMHELALRARNRNVVLLAGHTDAMYENMIEGMECGILHSTHIFNAMSHLHHRNPGAVGAILIHPEMCCEIIADGVHVHPEIIKMIVRQKPSENIVLVTDSLKPNHQVSGKLLANGTEVVLSKQGAFVSKDDESLLNGSALTLNKAVYNMKRWGIEPEISIRMMTQNPARIYGFKNIGSVVPGAVADISVFDENFNAVAVLVNGSLIRNTCKF